MKMAKRPAEETIDGGVPLKSGERPGTAENGEDMDFEDEFEDEYDSEDGIIEAGVDGRPDEKREGEESRGTWTTPKILCEYAIIHICSSYAERA